MLALRLFMPNRSEHIIADGFGETMNVLHCGNPNFVQNLIIYGDIHKRKQIYQLAIIEVVRIDIRDSLLYFHFKSAQATVNGKNKASLDIMPCIAIFGERDLMPIHADAADLHPLEALDLAPVQKSPSEPQNEATAQNNDTSLVKDSEKGDKMPDRPTEGICVDGSCKGGNDGNGVGRWRVTELDQSPLNVSGKFLGVSHNLMEFAGLVVAMAFLNKHDLKDSTIWTDSKTAMSWVEKKYVKTKIKWTEKNANFKVVFDQCMEFLHAADLSDFTIKKWQTHLWGQIPADFGNK